MSTLKVGTIQDHANSITAMTIDNAGRVLTPARPAFKASVGGNFGSRTTTDTIQITPYNDAQLNIGNCYNTSNYTFTAPVAGNYFFSISQNKYGKLIVYLYKNSTAFHAGEFLLDSSPNWEHCTISAVIPLAVNDTVTARCKLTNNSGTQYAWNGNSQSWDSFSGYLIG